jgi:hypothetical protein
MRIVLIFGLVAVSVIIIATVVTVPLVLDFRKRDHDVLSSSKIINRISFLFIFDYLIEETMIQGNWPIISTTRDKDPFGLFLTGSAGFAYLKI